MPDISDGFEFVRLSDLPTLVEACSKFHAEHSGDQSENGLQMRAAAFQRLALDGEEEDAIVALRLGIGTVAGLAVLLKSELDAFADLGPWLAGLTVSRSEENTDLKDRIRVEIETLADELGYTHICHHTHTPDLFKASGYQEIETFEKDGMAHTVIGKMLTGNPATD